MEVGRTEDLVPTLMDPATVPVTKGSARKISFKQVNLEEVDS